MEWFSAEFFTALLSIIIIDLVLAGDNAVVIGMAARNLPKESQKKAIFWGTFGAIGIRAVATLLVVYLLKIPFLLLAGGLVLIWISYKLLVEEKKHEEVKAGKNLVEAIKTIMIADAMMGLDNVIAVAGAAKDSYFLVILGLLISIPIVVWGSTLILKWMERFPFIIYFGAGVLAFTAAKMITDEPFLINFFEGNPIIKWMIILVIVAGVLLTGKVVNQKRKFKSPELT
ncbi:TerC family protein [Microaerobacter geothermalis]|uniref:TerC family protein n=1 Tax=Microaerobacter geothermalis TaxID=674972 RepID=UPI001F40AED7|nr:TerC family protein [Microaerobacter geothermalis]MCF6092490.1 TerC family protein [Microaerobacter geothermalis]